MKRLFIVAGMIWAIVGAGLLSLGVKLIQQGSFDVSIILLLSIALVIGLLKGRFVLRKTAQREITRIRNEEKPRLYSPRLLILIALMMSLGLCLRYFEVAGEIRGVIDVAVGFALIQGSMTYFKAATCGS